MRQAQAVIAEVVTAACPCGEPAIDKRTGSYSLTSDSAHGAVDIERM